MRMAVCSAWVCGASSSPLARLPPVLFPRCARAPARRRPRGVRPASAASHAMRSAPPPSWPRLQPRHAQLAEDPNAIETAGHTRLRVGPEVTAAAGSSDACAGRCRITQAEPQDRSACTNETDKVGTRSSTHGRHASALLGQFPTTSPRHHGLPLAILLGSAGASTSAHQMRHERNHHGGGRCDTAVVRNQGCGGGTTGGCERDGGGGSCVLRCGRCALSHSRMHPGRLRPATSSFCTRSPSSASRHSCSLLRHTSLCA